jgi:2-polyprenyl-3-methyl-5-hydroxy-6-metoxy-1,4-benzoquinol methylase
MERLDQEAAYYDRRWKSFQYANLYGLSRCLFILQAIRDLELNEPRICDLGCGAGWLTGILSALGPTVGVELSPVAVEQATQRYPTAQFICADATQWEPEAGAFDVVVSQEVIEHIRNKGDYLGVIHRALRPGGYLLMTTPNLDVLNSIPARERSTIWEIQPVELPLNRKQLDALLAECGFEVVGRGSVVTRCGKLGLQHLLNSHKLNALLSVLGLGEAWRDLLERTGYGMYLTTLALRR